MTSPFFWEDATQANERIANSYVLLDDKPAFIAGVSGGREPYAQLTIYPEGTALNVPLDDKRFHRFRRLPAIGWMNWGAKKTAAYLSRRPVRSRQHGLSDSNVAVGMLGEDYGMHYRDVRYNTVARDPFYAAACRHEFPSCEEIVSVIRPGSSIAFDHSYAVFCDSGGLKWFYRNDQRAGLFSGTDTLLLLGKHSYLREELADSKTVTVSNIKEF